MLSPTQRVAMEWELYKKLYITKLVTYLLYYEAELTISEQYIDEMVKTWTLMLLHGIYYYGSHLKGMSNKFQILTLHYHFTLKIFYTFSVI